MVMIRAATLPMKRIALASPGLIPINRQPITVTFAMKTINPDKNTAIGQIAHFCEIEK